jgi:hypothetical protein
MQNKQSCTWQSWLSIMYQTLNTGGTYQNVFWHHHTLLVHQQLSLENSIAGTKNHTELLQNLHTKEPSLLWASDHRCWWCGKELLLGIFCVLGINMYWRWGCYTEKSFHWQEMGNDIYEGNHIFMQNCPNCKTHTQIWYICNMNYQKQKENFCHKFLEKVWSGLGGGGGFMVVQFLLLTFIKKTHKFSCTSPSHPHNKATQKLHRIFVLHHGQ